MSDSLEICALFQVVDDTVSLRLFEPGCYVDAVGEVSQLSCSLFQRDRRTENTGSCMSTIAGVVSLTLEDRSRSELTW